MQMFKISNEQAQTIAKEIISNVHTYARNHATEFSDFLKMNKNNPPTAVYIDEDFDVKGGAPCL